MLMGKIHLIFRKLCHIYRNVLIKLNKYILYLAHVSQISNEYSMLIIHKHGLVHNPHFCAGLQDQTQYFKSFRCICTKPFQECIQTVCVHILGQLDTDQTQIEHKKQYLFVYLNMYEYILKVVTSFCGLMCLPLSMFESF